MSSTVYDSSGKALRLGGELGRGGEGRVLEVADKPGSVAKIYHGNVEACKAEKVSAMVHLRTEALLSLAAWPIDTLHSSRGGSFLGLLMPKVSGFREVHALYNPKSRLVQFSEAHWPFLVHVATNVARAFAVVHRHGHVIGDVNHGNVVVSERGIVRLIDCDSFQVSCRGRQFLCEVGVPTYTPPELQGMPFQGVCRTPNHDAFGLAVMIFHLLFMGRHPFAGRFFGAGEMLLERAIKEALFAYAAGASARQMRPPPGTLSLHAASPAVATLFERAFARDGGRPTAEEWVSALSSLARNLKQCGRNTHHHFLASLPTCPWCQIESATGVVYFLPSSQGSRLGSSTFDLAAFWKRIEAVQSPGPPPSLPAKTSLRVAPSQKALTIQKERRRGRLTALGCALFCAGVVGALMDSSDAFLPVVVILGIGVWVAMSSSTGPRGEAEQALQRAQVRWQTLPGQWARETGSESFDQQLNVLKALKAQYMNLPAVRQQKICALEAMKRERQLHRFLDRFRIDSADINGVGAGRKATLQSFNIETAADVTEPAIMAVPGFGPVLTANLLVWRRRIERRFVFNSNERVDPLDIAAIDHDITLSRQRIEQDLQKGFIQLEHMRGQIVHKRRSLLASLEAAARELAQAEADLSGIRRW